jgi:hypothetical protein
VPNNGPFFDDGNNDTTSYASTYYPGTGSVSEAQRITLGVGQEQPNVTFALQPVTHGEDHRHRAQLDGHGAHQRHGHLDAGRQRRPGRGPGPVLFNFRRQRTRACDGSFTIANVVARATTR